MEKLRQIFDGALEVAPAARAAFLERACGEDAALRERVEGLLNAYRCSEGFLENPLPLVREALLGDGDEQLLAGLRIGPYLIEREIGRGGMGSVYLAVRDDDEYRQQVAIKLVWPGLNHDEIIRRFRQERQILADLNHSGIARLLDGGKNEQGWPYLVMEYIDGVPITDYCDQHSLSVAGRLQLFQPVCEVVDFAHRHGVIHRDLKPGNIFVNRDGEIKLLDFGIAKVLRIDELDRPVSLSQSMLSWMTPEYASPEQLRNEPVTPASDVYSLGVVLYELLTGCRPYRLKRRLPIDVMQAVFEREPERPSERIVGEVDLTFNPVEENLEKLRRRLSGDLDNIVMKALTKDAARRYRSTAEMSADISLHLDGLPINARRPTLPYRANKLIRRNKRAALIAGSILMAALFIGLRMLWQWPERRQLELRQLYAAQIRQAEQDWRAGRFDNFHQTLKSWTAAPRGADEQDVTGFELGYLQNLSRRNVAWNRMPASLAGGWFIDQGEKFFVKSADGTAKIFETQTWHELASWKLNVSLYRSPSFRGELGMDLESPSSLRIWDLKDGKIIQHLSFPSSGIRGASFVPGGREVATEHVNGDLNFWELASGRSLRTLPNFAGPAELIIFGADRPRILRIKDQAIVELVDLETSASIARFKYPLLREAFFIGLGKWFLIFAGQKVVIGDSANGRILGEVTETDSALLAANMLNARLLATHRRDGKLNIYETPQLRLKMAIDKHDGPALCSALSSDGKILATGGGDQTTRLWDTATQQELAVVRGSEGNVTHLSFSFDGGKLVIGSGDSTFKVWNVAALFDSSPLRDHKGNVFSVAFSPDGTMLATASEDHLIRIWEVSSGRLLKSLTGHTGQVLCVGFSPDGRRLVSSGDDETAQVWDVSEGRTLFALQHPVQTHSAAFSPDGKLIATGADDGLIRLWDAESGQELRQLKGHAKEVWSVAFSRDGRSIASGSVDHSIKLWEVATGRLSATLAGHTEAVWSVTFSPDGKFLASGGVDRAARLWDLASRKEIQTFVGHTNEIFEVAFSPDGKRLATAGKDRTIKIWDPVIGQELLTLTDHKDQVWSVAFSPDGKTLASGSWDKTARLWRAMAQR